MDSEERKRIQNKDPGGGREKKGRKGGRERAEII
jgi:hypothetical protein